MKKILIILAIILVLVIGVLIVINRFKPQGGGDKSPKISQDCPDPFVFALPADINKVTSILYPGQIRGNNYKPHGGFRFDNSKSNEITVTAPYDANVIDGSKYLVSGEPQFTFDFEHPCGIRYRLGHLLTLLPKFQALADKLPQNSEGNSQTFQIRPSVKVEKGEVIATAVGVPNDGAQGGDNTFFDWGVYDYRKQNEASKAPDWSTRYASIDPSWSQYSDSEIYKYGVCWFDFIPENDRAKVLSLPSSDDRGKQSDYCLAR